MSASFPILALLAPSVPQRHAIKFMFIAIPCGSKPPVSDFYVDIMFPRRQRGQKASDFGEVPVKNLAGFSSHIHLHALCEVSSKVITLNC